MAQIICKEEEKIILDLDNDINDKIENSLESKVNIIEVKEVKKIETEEDLSDKFSKTMKKLIHKSKYNANYLKELKDINDVKAQVHYRNFNIY
ncbi:MAG: hypothetical protein GF317_15225 [Candidatus Lokiarchaeota archaeon]|nr:hypothetical protein [Candidatus Lokiarchaeota archaeon]MBD3200926.1 hypothetical protein [Candidatus Lokiarchaeota archaeon]